MKVITKQDKFGLFVVTALLIYVSYLLITNDIFVGLTGVGILYYLNFYYFYITIYFNEDKIIISYPFRFYKREFDYNNLKEIKKGSGTYLDPQLLIIKYKWKDKLKKVSVPFPKAKELEELLVLLEKNEIKIKNVC